MHHFICVACDTKTDELEKKIVEVDRHPKEPYRYVVCETCGNDTFYIEMY